MPVVKEVPKCEELGDLIREKNFSFFLVLFSLYLISLPCPFGGEAFIVPRVEIEVWVG